MPILNCVTKNITPKSAIKKFRKLFKIRKNNILKNNFYNLKYPIIIKADVVHKWLN